MSMTKYLVWNAAATLLPSLLIVPFHSTLPFFGLKRSTSGLSLSSSRYAASAKRAAENTVGSGISPT
jgi:hypothetical protein